MSEATKRQTLGPKAPLKAMGNHTLCWAGPKLGQRNKLCFGRNEKVKVSKFEMFEYLNVHGIACVAQAQNK